MASFGVDYYDNEKNSITVYFYLSTSTNKIQIAINAMKSISGIVRRAIRAMARSIHTNPKVLTFISKLGNLPKRFIF
jgi:hypothetical protein